MGINYYRVRSETCHRSYSTLSFLTGATRSNLYLPGFAVLVNSVLSTVDIHNVTLGNRSIEPEMSGFRQKQLSCDKVIMLSQSCITYQYFQKGI